MRIGTSQIDLAILLPAFAAAWNLAGGQTMFAAQKDSGRVYLSPDGLFAVEAPAGWEVRKQEGSNEVTFLNGEVSVSVAADAVPVKTSVMTLNWTGVGVLGPLPAW